MTGLNLVAASTGGFLRLAERRWLRSLFDDINAGALAIADIPDKILDNHHERAFREN